MPLHALIRIDFRMHLVCATKLKDQEEDCVKAVQHRTFVCHAHEKNSHGILITPFLAISHISYFFQVLYYSVAYMANCSTCNDFFQTEEALHAHCRDKADHPYCTPCERLFVTFDALDEVCLFQARKDVSSQPIPILSALATSRGSSRQQ